MPIVNRTVRSLASKYYHLPTCALEQ